MPSYIRFPQTSNGQYLQSESEHGPENHETYHNNQFSFQDTNPQRHNQYEGLPTSTPKKKKSTFMRQHHKQLAELYIKLDPMVQRLMRTRSSYVPLQEVSSKKYTSP